jgi:murein DD-endopeptidase MepM/ murein hydrolase activator NlpD
MVNRTRATRCLAVSGLALLLGLLVLGPSLAFAPPASAGPLSAARSDLQAARDQLGALQTKLDALAEKYATARDDVSALDTALKKAQADATRSERDLTTMQKQLSQHVVDLYKNGGSSNEAALLLEVLFEEKDLGSVLDRLKLLGKVANEDQTFYTQIGQHIENVNALEASLKEKRAEQAAKVHQMQGAQAALETELTAASAEYKRLRARVAALEEQARREAAAAAAAKARARNAAVTTYGPAARGFVFPVDGAHSFRNDWGDYRSAGGWHQATDIYATRGTPAVACVSGTIVVTPYDSVSGNKVWVYGDNGTHYFYCHLDSIAVSSGEHVHAGELVGYVGNTGNATGGPCHLHFEVHPGGGGPVNPYYLLRAAD